MRIGLDLLALASRGGGIRRYTEELLRGFIRVAGDAEFVLFGDSSFAADMDLDERFRWAPRRSLSVRHAIDQFHLLAAERGIDLFHGTNYWSPLWSTCPTVLTVHDLTVHLFPETHPWVRRARHRVLPRLCKNAKSVIADSDTTRGDLLRLYGLAPEKIHVVQLAVGPEFQPDLQESFLDPIRQRYGLPDAFILFVGSLNPRKNLPSLVKSVGKLRSAGIGIPLVIAGEGERSEKGAVQKAARLAGLEIGRDVLMTGRVPDADLPGLYCLSDVFVFPSRYEGFGLPPLEAMACGVPVVLSRNSSLAELYRDCAVFVDTEDTDQLASKISDLVTSSARRCELVERGVSRARERSWDHVARETMGIYRSVLQAR